MSRHKGFKGTIVNIILALDYYDMVQYPFFCILEKLDIMFIFVSYEIKKLL